jgi:hypothetical protein
MVVDTKVSIDRDSPDAGGSLRFIQKRIAAEYGEAEDGTRWFVWPPRLHGFVHCSLRNHAKH